jgi:hypothetical protein
VISPHRHLCLVNINLIWSTYYPATADFLNVIAQAASDGIFPCLRGVRVWEYRSQIDQAQINKFSQQGLTLEFTTRYKGRFLKFVPLCSTSLLLC